MKNLALASLLAFGCSLASAQTFTPMSGYLCCNMRTDGGWISDSNYAANGKRIVPFGTPVNVIGYGRYRVKTQMDGVYQVLGNDYSRDLSNEAFVKRYVVADDPRAAVTELPPKVQTAIQTMRVTQGMTKAQVLIAIGYPISSENPHLDVRQWRYWISSFSPFSVHFDAQDKVTHVSTDPDTLLKVFIE